MLRAPLLLALVASLVVPALHAQTPDAPRERGSFQPFDRRGIPDGLSFLVAIGEVREELEVNDSQEKLLTALMADLRNQRIALLEDARRNNEDPPADGRMRSMREIRQQGDELVSLVLLPGQAQRLQQLHLQYEGVAALNRDDFIKELQISDEQLSKIRNIRGLDRGRLPRRASAEQESAILSILTEQQKQAWDKLKGEVYVFPEWLAQWEPRFRGRPFRRERP